MKIYFIIIILLTSLSCFSQKQDSSFYYLLGKKSDFQLLYNAIKSPQDITPRQDSAIAHWILSIQKMEIQKPKTDSVKAKK